MNNTHRENGTMAGPLIFTVPAYGFVMALYLDCLGRTPTRERNLSTDSKKIVVSDTGTNRK